MSKVWIKRIQDNEDICYLCEPQIPQHKEKTITFYDLGLKVGDYIIFTKDEKY